MTNKDKVVKIAKECGFSVKDEMIVLEEHSDYTATQALYTFAQALEAHIVGDGEPVAYRYRYANNPYKWLHAGYADTITTGYIEVQPLYLAPPNYAELKADCDRYREALELVLTSDKNLSGRCDGGRTIFDVVNEALKGKGER